MRKTWGLRVSDLRTQILTETLPTDLGDGGKQRFVGVLRQFIPIPLFKYVQLPHVGDLRVKPISGETADTFFPTLTANQKAAHCAYLGGTVYFVPFLAPASAGLKGMIPNLDQVALIIDVGVDKNLHRLRSRRALQQGAMISAIRSPSSLAFFHFLMPGGRHIKIVTRD
jgi:hypothetical protein